MAVRPSLRISILSRDQFTCQYCGKRAPMVELHVDHIRSLSDGGSDHPANLVTSCIPCNLGKSSRSLIVEGKNWQPLSSCPSDYYVSAEPRKVKPASAEAISRYMRLLWHAHGRALADDFRQDSIYWAVDRYSADGLQYGPRYAMQEATEEINGNN